MWIHFTRSIPGTMFVKVVAPSLNVVLNVQFFTTPMDAINI